MDTDIVHSIRARASGTPAYRLMHAPHTACGVIENKALRAFGLEQKENVPGLQLSYFWNDDHIEGTLNGEAFTATPFTEGDAEISAYYNEMKVTVIGTLNNGKVLKLFVSSPY